MTRGSSTAARLLLVVVAVLGLLTAGSGAAAPDQGPGLLPVVDVAAAPGAVLLDAAGAVPPAVPLLLVAALAARALPLVVRPDRRPALRPVGRAPPQAPST